jgi:hypothetical protein
VTRDIELAVRWSFLLRVLAPGLFHGPREASEALRLVDGQIGLQRVRSSIGLAGGLQVGSDALSFDRRSTRTTADASAWLSRMLAAPSVAPACGWWIGGLGLKQSDAEQLTVLVDALDHEPVELELADDHGGKVNPTRAQLIERHWPLARLP